MAELEKFNLECLERVNELRKLFNVPPLKLRLTLILRPEYIDSSSYHGAQDWADNLASSDTLQTDIEAVRNSIGECICRLFSEKFCTFSGRAVISAWFDEAIEYKGTLSPDKVCHPVNFLQLIWAHTRYCGFGFAVSQSSSAMYAVARFMPMLPIRGENLAVGFNQQVQKFEVANGSSSFKNTILSNLSQDLSYVKRNLYCSIPESVLNQAEVLQTKPYRYRLSHVVRQTRVANRVGKHRMGLVYVNEQLDKPNDIIMLLQNDD